MRLGGWLGENEEVLVEVKVWRRWLGMLIMCLGIISIEISTCRRFFSTLHVASGIHAESDLTKMRAFLYHS